MKTSGTALLSTERPHAPGRLRSILRWQGLPRLLVLPFLLALAMMPLVVLAQQEKPLMEIDRNCEAFAISSSNRIACAVPQLKRMKKIMIQRADVWVASPNGKEKDIVEGEKFMPVPPPQSFIVNSLAWSPDGSRLVMNMTTQKPEADEDESPSGGGGRAIAVLDEEGHEIKVEGSKSRFVEQASSGTLLADNVTLVYLMGAGPYKIGRISTISGQSSTLFEGRTFDAVVWDAPHNQAVVLSQNLSVTGRQAIFQLDLVNESVREVARIDTYQGGLSLSPSGKKLAFFADGDAIEVHDLAPPSKTIRVRAGMGVFGWGHDEQHVLLKRGPPEKSGELIWVGLYDGTFVPALHGLEYHAFLIAPDGSSIAVTEPGKEILRVYPLQ